MTLWVLKCILGQVLKTILLRKVSDLYIRNYNLWSRSATIKKINPNQKLFKDNHSAFENSYYFDVLS